MAGSGHSLRVWGAEAQGSFDKQLLQHRSMVFDRLLVWSRSQGRLWRKEHHALLARRSMAGPVSRRETEGRGSKPGLRV